MKLSFARVESVGRRIHAATFTAQEPGLRLRGSTTRGAKPNGGSRDADLRGLSLGGPASAASQPNFSLNPVRFVLRLHDGSSQRALSNWRMLARVAQACQGQASVHYPVQ
eukprot:377420-Pyramimonas_sp.AAC.1